MKATLLSLFYMVCSISLAGCNGFFPDKSNPINDSLAVAGNQVNKNPIRYLPIPDYQNNMVMALLPVPADWDYYKGSEKDVFLQGPNGIKGFYIQGNTFMFSPNAYINQSYQQMGFETKPFEPVDDAIQYLQQALGKDGFKLNKQYNLSQFERAAQAFDQQIYKGEPEQKSFKVVGTEWEKDGKKTLIVIQHFYAQTQTGYYWGYNMESMEAPVTSFDTAKMDYLNAKLNVRINPAWMSFTNNQRRQASQKSRGEHERRMGDLKAYGEQIIVNGKQHDAMTTRIHQKFMDGLTDKITVTSPSTGQNYKVDLGNNHYWINDQNQLITTDNANYNPNGDLNVNDSWEETQINY